MELFLDLLYVPQTGKPDSRDRPHEFDLYVPHVSLDKEHKPALICFIHGGAWRSEDKADHSTLAQNLATFTGCPVAVPNYRLTPREPTADSALLHPAHAEDILRFLTFAHEWDGSPISAGPLYDPERIFLMGHSCGAHMLASIILDSAPITPSLAPRPALLRAVQGVILSEGIYDIDLLLASSPDYRTWFIASAFGEHHSYAAYATTNFPVRKDGGHIRWLVVHSKGDTLVDQRQSEVMYEHLQRIHEEQDGGSSNRRVFKDWEALNEEHNDILRGDIFVRVVGDFVSGQRGSSV